MTLSLPKTVTLGAIVGALAWSALSIGALTVPSAAEARTSAGPFYTVQLAQPTEETRAVAAGVAWKCQGTTCVADKSTSRPLRVCRELQREVGDVASFTANGKALEAEDLARCNA